MKKRPSTLKGVGRYAYNGFGYLTGESTELHNAKKDYDNGEPEKLIDWLAKRGWEREPVFKVKKGGIRRRIL